jgi:DNA repair protein RecO (recombination protein O)
MRVEQQPAFVLHARAYRETSLLLECFTRDHGRIGIVARGVRKERSPLPRALQQPLVPLSVSWSGGGELATLTGVEAGDAQAALAGDRLLCGLYLNELVLRMTLRLDPHADLFDVYAATLRLLAEAPEPAWTLRRFERELLERLGYGASLTVDALSGESIDAAREYGYRHEIGTVPWRSAADGPRVSGTALLALVADSLPSPQDLRALRRWMRAVIAGHLEGGVLQSWKLLAEAPLRRGE